MANIAFQMESPYITKKRYAKITGLSIDTVNKRVAAGKIPIQPKESEKGSVLINMVAIFKQADEQVF